MDSPSSAEELGDRRGTAGRWTGISWRGPLSGVTALTTIALIAPITLRAARQNAPIFSARRCVAPGT
ncbi:hypothetical protein [Actinomadura madurae]|uniref:hypothetical protein n=1 Tax=Actinomadura madurae TaxID=1993 RepID=UPI0020D24870|nr:hypothetical protein [Actinomadura madurae]MCQ0012550.1 hypothetical protein [Actinomadura madurae]